MPILNTNSFDFISRSPEQTQRIGIRLGSYLRTHDVVCLSGELGSGKTTLAQGIARGWGSTDMATSPTFVLVNNYRKSNGSEMNHLDAYRLQNAMEAEDLDIISMMAAGPFLVEWAERIKDALPAEHLWINLQFLAEEQRSLIFIPHGQRYIEMVKDLRKDVVKSFT